MGETYEQRHYNPILGQWSDWYPSSAKAYREQLAGPVKCYEVRHALRSKDAPDAP